MQLEETKIRGGIFMKRQFQFHIGAIRSIREMEPKNLDGKFQFHIGAIRSETKIRGGIFMKRQFQFHIGAIRSQLN